jgi:hypothetical protein
MQVAMKLKRRLGSADQAVDTLAQLHSITRNRDMSEFVAKKYIVWLSVTWRDTLAGADQHEQASRRSCAQGAGPAQGRGFRGG